MTITWFSATSRSWTILRRVSSLAILLLTLVSAGRGESSSCDLNLDGEVNVVDVQNGVNQSLGIETCSSADVNSDSNCNVVDVQIVINGALGSVCPTKVTESPEIKPWVTGFTPKRIHYVSASGSGNGTIGSPESLSAANSHDACGDLHIFRGGTYLISSQLSGSDGTWGPSLTCTSGNPSVWKGYVDPATGQPERAKIDGSIRPTGAHQWFMNLEATITQSTVVGQSINVRGEDIKIINNVVHDTYKSSNIGGFGYARTVVYGNSSYRGGVNPSGGGPSHAVYMNGNCAGGMKYIVQNILLEPAVESPDSERMIQLNDSTGGKGIDCFHLEANFLGDGANEESTMLWSSTGGLDVTTTVVKDNFLVDLYHSSSVPASLWMMERENPMTAKITGNYFAKASAWIEGYWGNVGARTPFEFKDNQIYAPPGGVHVVLKTGYLGTNGSQKIPDADTWDNNFYGGTFNGRIWCGGTNHGTSTLAQWRTRTSGCRVTAGAGFDANSKAVSNPTTDKVAVIENDWQCASGCPFTDQARGNVYCVNWDGNSTCNADISSVVGPGKTYAVRYARDFYGTAAASGTCPASGACNVSLPTRRSSGEASGKFANAYVITGQP